jgi:hypothetical protein
MTCPDMVLVSDYQRIMREWSALDGSASLTFSRTVSVAYNNGTIIDVAKVEAPTEYKELMNKLSLESSKHPR